MIKMSNNLEKLMQELKKTNSETFYHSLRTKRYTNEMVILMNDSKMTDFSQNEIDSICKGAILHDIGKLNVDNFILTKEYSLTSEEKKDIKNHTRLGWEIVKNEIDESEHEIIKNICLYHHERIGGGGYEGLEDIPVYVRIVGICDAFDAIHSDRIYRAGCAVNRAMEMLKNGDCGRFDDKLIELMEQIAAGIKE